MKQGKSLKKPVFWVVYSLVIAACIAIDQLSKYFVGIAVTENGGKIKIIGDWLTLVWTSNPDGMGSLFQNLSWRNILFFVITLIGLPIFVLLLKRSRTRSVWGQISFAFFIGGTIGNAIDRIVFAEKGFFTGGVRDFIRVEGFFGIFNLADSFLVVGVFMALLAILFFDYDSLVNVFKEDKSIKLAEQARNSVLSDSKESSQKEKSETCETQTEQSDLTKRKNASSEVEQTPQDEQPVSDGTANADEKN